MNHGLKIPVRILLPFLLLGGLLPPRALAQDLALGGRIGGSFSTFGGEASEGLDSHRSGLLVGGVIAWRVRNHLAVQGELTWIQKGARGTLQGFEEPLAVDLRLEYLEVPVLLRVTVPVPGRVQPTISAGGAVSFETGCKVGTPPEELALTFGCQDSGPEVQRRTTDWSLLAGAGIEYVAGTLQFALDVRYGVGLVELGDVAGLKSRGGSVSAAVLVPLRR